MADFKDCYIIFLSQQGEVFYMLKIKELKINRLEQPVGIVGQPDIGWNLSSDRKNVYQVRYTIKVSRTPDFSDICLETGKESAQCIGITLDVPAEDFTVYYVAVRVWDSDNEESGWEKTTFTTGLQDAALWQGAFISAEGTDEGASSKGTCLRKNFVLEKSVRKAYALSTALGLYRLYLNGKRVGTDVFTPGWTSYNNRLLYQIYDVTGLLSKGTNAAGMILGPGWYKGEVAFRGDRNLYGKRTAGSLMLVVEYDDGTRQTVATNESWKGAGSPLLYSEIYHGETYDARLYDGAWATAEFDDSEWKKTETVSYPRAKLIPQPGCRVTEHERFPAQKIITTPEGDTVIDFGQNLAGWVEFRAAAPRGTKLEFICFETLDSKGNVYLANLRSAKQTITYYCSGSGMETYHPFFSYQGFRYIKLVSWYGAPELTQFTAVSVYSDMEETGKFSCSNPLVNQLQHNILWGMKSNFLDVPTDCPQRDERLGWTGDAQIFCSTAAFLMDTDLFYRKWLQDLSLDQQLNGEISHVVPDVLTKINGCTIEDSEAGASGSAAWADAAVINTWNMYLAYADLNIIREQYSCMKAFVDSMYRNTVNNTWPMKKQFGDWVALDAKEGSYKGATPDEMICLGYEYYSTMLFSRMSEIIGRQADAAKYEARADNVKRLYQKKFFTKNGGLRIRTQTAHIISLYFNMVENRNKPKIVDGLLDLIAEHQGHLTTGFVGTPYFCHVLSDNGHTAEAYELLLKEDFPSWLYQVKKGATTVWEHWDGLKEDGTMWSADMNSFNHYAYGSIGDWLYKVCAGLVPDPEQPGYKHFYLHPHIGGDFTWAEISYRSTYGLIHSRWEKVDGRIRLSCMIPENTTATIILAHCGKMIEKGGIAFNRRAESYIGTTGSGTYVIEYQYD
jgi:alpha-L-rhamnosidase